MEASVALTKDEFVAEAARLAAEDDAAGMRRLAEQYLAEMLPRCTPEEAEWLDGVMGATYRLADAREAATAGASREHAA